MIGCCYSNCRRCPFVDVANEEPREPATTWCERCQATVYVAKHECEEAARGD